MFEWFKKIFGPSSARPDPNLDILSRHPMAKQMPKEFDLAAWAGGKSTSDLGPPGEEYDRLFEAAIARTKRFNLLDEEIALTEGRVLHAGNIKRMDDAVRLFVNTALDGYVAHMAGQCFAVCLHLEKALEGVYLLDPVLTVGSVYGYKGRIFGIDVDLIESAIAGDVQTRSASADLHAWLTFPTGEIVDPTLLTTVAVGGFNIGVESQLYKLVHGYPRDLPKLRYEPQIVGSAILSQLGFLRAGWYVDLA